MLKHDSSKVLVPAEELAQSTITKSGYVVISPVRLNSQEFDQNPTKQVHPMQINTPYSFPVHAPKQNERNIQKDAEIRFLARTTPSCDVMTDSEGPCLVKPSTHTQIWDLQAIKLWRLKPSVLSH